LKESLSAKVLETERDVKRDMGEEQEEGIGGRKPEAAVHTLAQTLLLATVKYRFSRSACPVNLN
jgi:hypothetical protein